MCLCESVHVLRNFINRFFTETQKLRNFHQFKTLKSTVFVIKYENQLCKYQKESPIDS